MEVASIAPMATSVDSGLDQGMRHRMLIPMSDSGFEPGHPTDGVSATLGAKHTFASAWIQVPCPREEPCRAP